jgi:Zn finger protein HypA/HybF involved in hydrogenase expression
MRRSCGAVGSVRACATLLACMALAVVAGLRTTPAHADEATSQHGSSVEGLDCSLCHTTAGWKPLSVQGPMRFDHARTGFPLTGRHANTPCTGCHAGSAKLSRQCNHCHDDAHQGRLGSDCSECHSALSFGTVRSFERHRLTRLPLTGMHALIECTQCHRRTAAREWSSVPADCYACHEREYRRTDIHPLHAGRASGPGAPAFPRDCAQCHRATAWSPAIVDPRALRDGVSTSLNGLTRAPAAHDTLFPIQRGPHRGASCNDCHASERVAQAVRCTGCHLHNPVTLQTQHRNLTSSLREGSCLPCHRGGARR